MSSLLMRSAVAMALVLLGCGPATPTLRVTPPATSTPHMAVDCGWRVPVSAWIDLDADSSRDADEPPLAGVTFVLENTKSVFDRRAASAMTNPEGEAGLSAWLPGCPAAEFEVYAEVPAGYRATTPSRVASEFNKPVAVGFVKEP